MKTSPNSTQLELLPTSSQADFHAKISASREKVQDWQAPALDYGPSSCELLTKLDPNLQSWRTSQRCLIEGWSRFSETWPRSGMMQNGIAFQLQPLVRLTDEIASGSLPTPVAYDATPGGPNNHYRGLGHMAKFPTPTATDTTAGPSRMRGDFQKYRGIDLATHAKMFPTPTASDTKRMTNMGGRPALSGFVKQFPTPCASDYYVETMKFATDGNTSRGKSLGTAVHGGTGQLNPTWVEWLMGYPTGWTDLKD